MICPQCSANLPDKSVFCGKCGKKLALPSNNQTPKEPSPSNIQESDLPNKTMVIRSLRGAIPTYNNYN